MDYNDPTLYYPSNFNDLLYDEGDYSFTFHPSASYEPPPFFSDYDLLPPYSTLSHYAASYSEPEHIEYEPPPCYYAETKFFVSYSVNSLDDTDFEEYDPTPYGGGYDILSTYGKPLPPSDKTCYPRSDPTQNSSLSKGNPEAEYVDDSAPIIPGEVKPSSVIDEVKEGSLDMELGQEERSNVNGEAGNGYDQVAYVPSGYGLEAMDLCESLFGYWPCLSKIKRTAQDCQEPGHCHHCGSHGNPWNGTADYLFGSWDPYRGMDDRGNSVYGYENRYQEQNQLVKYVYDPWLA